MPSSEPLSIEILSKQSKTWELEQRIQRSEEFCREMSRKLQANEQIIQSIQRRSRRKDDAT